MPSYQDNDAVIISGVRTPIGKFQGSLSELSAPQLGAIVLKEVVNRAKLKPEQIDECIMGNVVSAGLGQNPARQAALFGGLAPEVGAMTINKVCGSGLKAVALAGQAVQTGNSDIVVAGGTDCGTFTTTTTWVSPVRMLRRNTASPARCRTSSPSTPTAKPSPPSRNV